MKLAIRHYEQCKVNSYVSIGHAFICMYLDRLVGRWAGIRSTTKYIPRYLKAQKNRQKSAGCQCCL